MAFIQLIMYSVGLARVGYSLPSLPKHGATILTYSWRPILDNSNLILASTLYVILSTTGAGPMFAWRAVVGILGQLQRKIFLGTLRYSSA